MVNLTHIIATKISKNGYIKRLVIATFPWKHSKEKAYCLDNLYGADDTDYKRFFPWSKKTLDLKAAMSELCNADRGRDGKD